MPKATKYKSLYAFTLIFSNPGATMGDGFPEPHFVNTNGIRMAVYEQGAGPAIILLHGFPELAFSWRHQLPALAAAGYRAIAPDQRGYGRTDCPAQVADYRIQQLAGDVCGLLDGLQLQQAIFVGHDWGALLLWHMSLTCPERIERQVILNIPFYARPAVDPIALMRDRLGENFYIVNFQDSDEADRAFAADSVHFFNMLMRKGQMTREQYTHLPPEKKVLDLLATMARERSGGTALLTDAERDYFAAAFAKSGFSGPINWYRNWSSNWASLAGVRQVVQVPTLFIGAENDVIVAPEHIESMKKHVVDLEVRMLDDCGHWTQQEKPDEVNSLILDWLKRRSVQ